MYRMTAGIFALCLVTVGLALTVPSSGAAEPERDEADRLAREAGEQFEAGKYRAAADLFMQAWDAIQRADPRPLRNAARALETGSLLGEAVERWEQLLRLPDMGPLDTKAAALMRKEAYVHSHELRQQLAREKAEEADTTYEARQFRKAGDLYIRAFTVSERREPAYLRFAAKSYQEGGQFADAILGWANYAEAPGVGAIGKKEAERQIGQLQQQHEAITRASAGQRLYSAGKFNEAGEAFLTAWESGAGKEPEQLRMAALAFEPTDAKDRALELWRRYRSLSTLSELGKDEADEHVRGLELAKARQEALALEGAKRYSEAGDKWLGVFTVGLQRDAEPFEKAAIAYENAAKAASAADRVSAYGKARAMWLRFATAPQVREEAQDRAAKRAAELTTTIDNGGNVAVPRPAPRPSRTQPPSQTFCWLLITGGAVAISAGVAGWISAQAGDDDVAARRSRDVTYDATPAKAVVNRESSIANVLFSTGAAAVAAGVVLAVVRGRDAGEKPGKGAGGRVGAVLTTQGAVLTWQDRF